MGKRLNPIEPLEGPMGKGTVSESKAVAIAAALLEETRSAAGHYPDIAADRVSLEWHGTATLGRVVKIWKTGKVFQIIWNTGTGKASTLFRYLNGVPPQEYLRWYHISLIDAEYNPR